MYLSKENKVRIMTELSNKLSLPALEENQVLRQHVIHTTASC